MKRRLQKVGLLVSLLSLFVGFMVTAAIAADIDPAKGEFVKGKYTNKAPAFTIQFPENWQPAPTQLAEIFRVIGSHPWKVPVATLQIIDKPKDAPELGSDASVAEYMAFLKKNEPQSTNHEIEKKGTVTLKDGTKAMTLFIRWEWNPSIELISSVLQIYKGDKIISLLCSTVEAEGTSYKDMLNMLMTVEFK